MSELTTERLEKRIKNCIEVGNDCVMLPVSGAEELLAYRKAAKQPAVPKVLAEVHPLLVHPRTRKLYRGANNEGRNRSFDGKKRDETIERLPRSHNQRRYVMKDILLTIRENLQMGYTLSFIEAQLLQQAIDVIVILDENSPVIPDGWKLVPIEPTENMIIDGFESEPDKTFSKPEVWEEYAAMSGCKQAAHRAKLCWAAMLAAAPTAQEQK